jgi:Recombinase zinc beta ribbon domain
MTRLVRSIWRAQMKELMSRGAVKRGPSLLAGLLLCDKCRRKIHVAYSGSHGQVPRYDCREALVNHGECGCISFGGHRVDEAIEREVLRVLSPGATRRGPSDRCVTR